MTKRQALLVSLAAQRVQTAIAELSVGSSHLRVRKVGTSPPEFYELNKVLIDLDGIWKRLRGQLGEEMPR